MALGIGKKHLARVGGPRRTTWVVAILLVVATAAFGVSTAGANKAVPVATGAMVPAHKTDKCIGFSEDRYLELQNCTESADQVAELRHVTDGYFELAIGQDCAHIENYSSQKDARIVASDCGLVQANMLWKPTSKGLTSKLVNYCMTVFHNSGHHGAPVIQDSCGGAWYQRYTIGGTSVEGLTDPTKPGNPPVVVTTTTAAPATTTTAAPTSVTSTPNTITSTTVSAPTTTAPPTTESTTTTATPGVMGKPAKVSNYNTEMCVGMGETSQDPTLQPCETNKAMDVAFAAVGSNGAGQLRLGNECLTPENGSGEMEASVVLANCDTADESLWVPADWRWNQDLTMLRNIESGLCLKANDRSENAELSQGLCNPMDDRQQLWDSTFADGMMAKDLNNIPPVSAKFHGTLDFNSFHEGTYKMDSWTHGDIAFYAPPGRVTNEMANRWVAWYAHMDALHRKVWNQDNFDSVYRTTDPNHGRKKVVALIDKGKCSCGNKQQAEVLGFTDWIVEDPTNWMFHWVIFYEMNRGGPTPDFYARATWPNTHQGGLILPHMMAGLAFYELGGPAGLERDVLGGFMQKLTAWKMEETKPLAQLEIPADIQMGILLTILQDRGTDTFIQTLHNMADKPDATSATQALCDFRDAVNASTGGAYNSRMTNDWRLPTSC